MRWPKSLLAEITAFAVALAILLPLAAWGASRHMAVYFVYVIIWGFALPIVLAHWVAADMRQRGRTPPYELPFFLLITWPLSLFWYCAWTRGPQGLGLALGLVALTYLPIVSATILLLAWVAVTQ